MDVVGLDAAANGVTGVITDISLHSADPGTTGASEIAGNNYARLTPAYGSADATGTADLSASLVFNAAAGTTVAYWGAWAGTTFLEGAAISPTATFTDNGTFTLTSAPAKAQ